MTKTFFCLKNKSGSEGTYLYKNEYVTLAPKSEIVLESKPVNHTENIKISSFTKEVKETVEKKTKTGGNKGSLIEEAVVEDNEKGE